MNEKTESDILLYMMEHAYTSQRQISEEIGCSLGVVNRCIKKMSEDRMLNADGVLSIDAKKSVECRSPRQAIILAAGTGMRMVPINMEISKGMLEVKGEALIERVIWQLHESGIRNMQVKTTCYRLPAQWIFWTMRMSYPVIYGANTIHSTGMKLIPGTWFGKRRVPKVMSR